MLSLQAQLTSDDLLHPFQTFVTSAESTPSKATSQLLHVEDYVTSKGSASKVACDVRILDAPMLPLYTNPLDDYSFATSSESAILVHRLGFDGRFLESIPISGCSLVPQRLGRVSCKFHRFTSRYLVQNINMHSHIT